MVYSESLFPLRGTRADKEIHERSPYKNAVESPVIDNQVTPYVMFQDVREILSIQDKRTTPLENAKMAGVILSQNHGVDVKGLD